MNSKWYKFLITEAEQRMFNMSNVSYSEFEDEFRRYWQTSEYFRTSIIKLVIEKMLIPCLKNLPKEKFLEIKQAVMDGTIDSKRYSVPSEIRLAYGNNNQASNIQYLSNGPILLFLNLLFFPKDGMYNKQVREESMASDLQDVFYYFFSANPEFIPTKPELKKAVSPNKEENLKLINIHFSHEPIPGSRVKDKNILDDVKLTGYIGGGVYGKVFKTSDDQALKIFMDSVSLQKDLQRMSKVVDEVYQGSASLSDMHYFDYGQLGTSPYYYALMPLIVPLEKAPFFDLSPVFSEAVNASYDAVGYFRYRSNTPGYTEFKDQVLQALPNLVASYGQDGLDDINRYKDTINAIIYAAYRASTEYKGTDLHSGNIGYFAQKPDKFFFYDM